MDHNFFNVTQGILFSLIWRLPCKWMYEAYHKQIDQCRDTERERQVSLMQGELNLLVSFVHVVHGVI
jgi:hypothetical protein